MCLIYRLDQKNVFKYKTQIIVKMKKIRFKNPYLPRRYWVLKLVSYWGKFLYYYIFVRRYIMSKAYFINTAIVYNLSKLIWVD